MNVYVTGRNALPGPEETGIALSQEGIDVRVFSPDMSLQEIYDEVLSCDAVLIIWAGLDEDYPDLAAELGMAIALGKTVYVAKYSFSADCVFLVMPGVRCFFNVEKAIQALVEDSKETPE